MIVVLNTRNFFFNRSRSRGYQFAVRPMVYAKDNSSSRRFFKYGAWPRRFHRPSMSRSNSISKRRWGAI